MLLFNYRYLFLFLLIPQIVLGGIDDMACLKGNFQATVSHEGFPFGMTKNILDLSKSNCEITVKHEKLKFIKNKWLIDVCRAPVHIKAGSTSGIEVLKKERECSTDSKSKNNEFCQALVQMEKIIQDDGLIFAKGEKENLSSEHGKIYCTYVLLRAYLRHDRVLSRTDEKLSFNLENPGQSKYAPIKESGKRDTRISEQDSSSRNPINQFQASQAFGTEENKEVTEPSTDSGSEKADSPDQANENDSSSSTEMGTF